jgi:hypothetical protein
VTTSCTWAKPCKILIGSVQSSGICRRVTRVRNDISEEYTASIFRTKRFGDFLLLFPVSREGYPRCELGKISLVNLKMGVIYSAETSILLELHDVIS